MILNYTKNFECKNIFYWLWSYSFFNFVDSIIEYVVLEVQKNLYYSTDIIQIFIRFLRLFNSI